MTLRRFLFATALLLLAFAVVAIVVPTSTAAPSSKISARVLNETAHGSATEALIVLTRQADLTPAAALHTKLAKGRFVVNSLR